MIDLQLKLSGQFEMCSDLEEQVMVHMNYETKINHDNKQLNYCNILLNAHIVEPPIWGKDTYTQVPVSQDAYLVEALSVRELTEITVSMSLEVSARPKSFLVGSSSCGISKYFTDQTKQSDISITTFGTHSFTQFSRRARRCYIILSIW